MRDDAIQGCFTVKLGEDQEAVLIAERLYEDMRSQLEREHLHEFIAIEPVSGDYFFGRTLSDAIQASLEKWPERLPVAMRVGDAVGVELGGGL